MSTPAIPTPMDRVLEVIRLDREIAQAEKTLQTLKMQRSTAKHYLNSRDLNIGTFIINSRVVTIRPSACGVSAVDIETSEASANIVRTHAAIGV